MCVRLLYTLVHTQGVCKKLSTRVIAGVADVGVDVRVGGGAVKKMPKQVERAPVTFFFVRNDDVH